MIDKVVSDTFKKMDGVWHNEDVFSGNWVTYCRIGGGHLQLTPQPCLRGLLVANYGNCLEPNFVDITQRGQNERLQSWPTDAWSNEEMANHLQ